MVVTRKRSESAMSNNEDSMDHMSEDTPVVRRSSRLRSNVETPVTGQVREAAGTTVSESVQSDKEHVSPVVKPTRGRRTKTSGSESEQSSATSVNEITTETPAKRKRTSSTSSTKSLDSELPVQRPSSRARSMKSIEENVDVKPTTRQSHGGTTPTPRRSSRRAASDPESDGERLELSTPRRSTRRSMKVSAEPVLAVVSEENKQVIVEELTVHEDKEASSILVPIKEEAELPSDEQADQSSCIQVSQEISVISTVTREENKVGEIREKEITVENSCIQLEASLETTVIPSGVVTATSTLTLTANEVELSLDSAADLTENVQRATETSKSSLGNYQKNNESESETRDIPSESEMAQIDATRESTEELTPDSNTNMPDKPELSGKTVQEVGNASFDAGKENDIPVRVSANEVAESVPVDSGGGLSKDVGVEEENDKGSRLNVVSSSSESPQQIEDFTLSVGDSPMKIDVSRANVLSAVKNNELHSMEKGTHVTAPASIPRGKNVSGRFWRDPKERFKNNFKDKGLKSSKEQYEKLRLERARVKLIEQKMKEEKKQKIEELRKRQQLKGQRKEINDRRGEVVQVIKNTAKLKTLSKKQRRLIQKRDTTNLVKS